MFKLFKLFLISGLTVNAGMAGAQALEGCWQADKEMLTRYRSGSQKSSETDCRVLYESSRYLTSCFEGKSNTIFTYRKSTNSYQFEPLTRFGEAASAAGSLDLPPPGKSDFKVNGSRLQVIRYGQEKSVIKEVEINYSRIPARECAHLAGFLEKAPVKSLPNSTAADVKAARASGPESAVGPDILGFRAGDLTRDAVNRLNNFKNQGFRVKLIKDPEISLQIVLGRKGPNPNEVIALLYPTSALTVRTVIRKEILDPPPSFDVLFATLKDKFDFQRPPGYQREQRIVWGVTKSGTVLGEDCFKDGFISNSWFATYKVDIDLTVWRPVMTDSLFANTCKKIGVITFDPVRHNSYTVSITDLSALAEEFVNEKRVKEENLKREMEEMRGKSQLPKL